MPDGLSPSKAAWEGQLRLPDGDRKSVHAPTETEAIEKLADAGWRAAQGLPSLYTQLTVRDYLA